MSFLKLAREKLKKVEGDGKDDKVHEILPGFFISSFDGAENEEELEKHHVKFILNLAPEIAKVRFDTVTYKIIEAFDVIDYDLRQHFEDCIEFIESSEIGPENALLVHCRAGISRSVTIATAFVMKHKQLKTKEALAIVKKARFQARPNDGFMKQLINFEDDLDLD